MFPATGRHRPLCAGGVSGRLRQVVILNYSHTPPQVLVQVTLDDAGHVQIVAHSAHMRAHLDHGLLEWPSRRYVQATEGARFMDLLAVTFSGSYARAVEE